MSGKTIRPRHYRMSVGWESASNLTNPENRWNIHRNHLRILSAFSQSDNQWRSTKRCQSRSTASYQARRIHDGWTRWRSSNEEERPEPSQQGFQTLRKEQRRSFWWGSSSLPQTWIRLITLDPPLQQPVGNRIGRLLWIWVETIKMRGSFLLFDFSLPLPLLLPFAGPLFVTPHKQNSIGKSCVVQFSIYRY